MDTETPAWSSLVKESRDSGQPRTVVCYSGKHYLWPCSGNRAAFVGELGRSASCLQSACRRTAQWLPSESSQVNSAEKVVFLLSNI